MRVLKGKPDEAVPGRPRVKQSVIVEKSYSEERTAELRLLLLRDETGKVVEMMGESFDDLRRVGELLSDPGAGVPVLAADALRHASSIGIDISSCEEDLRTALGDKYARRMAAGALAHHYHATGQEEKAADLVVSKVPDIAEGAMEGLGGSPGMDEKS